MMNALLVALVLAQDPDVAVSGQGRHHDGEYELVVTGKGKRLKDEEAVSLRFRRIVHRASWSDGVIGTVTLDDESGRVAYVDKKQFVHHERFVAPGEVEVRVVLPQGEGGAEIRKVFRVSSLSEEASALAAASKRFEGALHGVRLMLDDVEAMKDDPCPAAKRQAHLQKRIDARMSLYRKEIEPSFLGASAHALTQLLADVEVVIELERTGKSAEAVISTLTGKPFAWAEVRGQVAAIEALSLRERGLLMERTLVGLVREIAAAGREPKSWPHVEKEFARTIEEIRKIDQESRTGPTSAQFATLVDGTDGTLTEVIQQTHDYLQAATAAVQGSKGIDAGLSDRERALMDRLAQFETHARTKN